MKFRLSHKSGNQYTPTMENMQKKYVIFYTRAKRVNKCVFENICLRICYFISSFILGSHISNIIEISQYTAPNIPGTFCPYRNVHTILPGHFVPPRNQHYTQTATVHTSMKLCTILTLQVQLYVMKVVAPHRSSCTLEVQLHLLGLAVP